MEGESSIKERLEAVEERITLACQKCGRSRGEVNLLAVTKTMPPAVCREALAAGLCAFGESYVQELRPKMAALADEKTISWHFIGNLQSNKAKYLENCALIHSLDSLETAKELDRHTSEIKKVLVEVNCGEAQKGGVNPKELFEFISKLLDYPHIEVAGLMTVPPASATDNELAGYFAALARLRDEAASKLALKPSFKELSMGMSSDFEIAIAAGATWIRLGSILFGQRSAARWWQQ